MHRMLILIVALALLAPVAATAQPGICGDFDGSGHSGLSDFIAFVDYLNGVGPPPDSLHLMDVDGYPGITVGDPDKMVDCLFTFCGGFECGGTRTYGTSTRIVYVKNDPVPAGAASHVIQVWVEPDHELSAFSFPFVYSCAGSSVILDSMAWESTLPTEGFTVKLLSSDSASSSGLIAFQTFVQPLTVKNRIARLYFSVTPQSVEQQIVIDTTSGPGDHTLLVGFYGYPGRPALYGTPTTPASPPSCCEGMTGDVNLDGNVTLGDLTLLVNFLFNTFEPLPCPAEGNTFGDDKCYLNLTDVTWLMNRLFVTFQPTDYCNQFDNFICGQFY